MIACDRLCWPVLVYYDYAMHWSRHIFSFVYYYY